MRYLPLGAEDRAAMLDAIGVSDIDELYRDVPEAARTAAIAELPAHQGEMEVERALGALAARNVAAGAAPSFLGAGAYRHHIPASVDHITQRSEYLTSYTPYQPEISQGTLQSLFEFQTQVALLTGMDVANAGMYDGSTACAEAVLMASRLTKRRKAVISGGLHPHYRDILATSAAFSGIEVVLAPPDVAATETLAGEIDAATACVVVQNPGFFGHVRDLAPLARACHDAGALLVVVVTEVVSLGAVTLPGAMGADIVVAEGQSLGVGLQFGGPYVGLFATAERFMRQLPGRLCGQTVDADGRTGYVLTLSTREQHIRREKATSNICTSSGLCALAFCIHVSLLGEVGLSRLSRLNHERAVGLSAMLAELPGVEVINDTFFNEFTVGLDTAAAPLVEALAARGILCGVPVSRLYPDSDELANLLLVAITETATDADVAALCAGMREVLS